MRFTTSPAPRVALIRGVSAYRRQRGRESDLRTGNRYVHKRPRVAGHPSVSPMVQQYHRTRRDSNGRSMVDAGMSVRFLQWVREPLAGPIPSPRDVFRFEDPSHTARFSCRSRRHRAVIPADSPSARPYMISIAIENTVLTGRSPKRKRGNRELGTGNSDRRDDCAEIQQGHEEDPDGVDEVPVHRDGRHGRIPFRGVLSV